MVSWRRRLQLGRFLDRGDHRCLKWKVWSVVKVKARAQVGWRVDVSRSRMLEFGWIWWSKVSGISEGGEVEFWLGSG